MANGKDLIEMKGFEIKTTADLQNILDIITGKFIEHREFDKKRFIVVTEIRLKGDNNGKYKKKNS